MVIKKYDFLRVFKSHAAAAVMVLAISAPAIGADNGCSDIDKNPYVSAELALCSTHAYNIGLTTNPPAGADRQLMADVVALKATLMTQQIKKQYDYLDATLKRLKTQLERAVLTTKLQAAGATGDDDSGTSSGASYGGASSSSNVVNGLSSAQNCDNMIIDTEQLFSCLSSNYSLINTVTNGGQNLSIEARKQLARDCANANRAKSYTEHKEDDLTKVKVTGTNNIIDCTIVNKLNSRKNFQECLKEFANVIRKQNEHNKRQNNKSPFVMMGN